MSYYARQEFTRRTGMLLGAPVVIVWVFMCSGCQTAPARDYCSIAKSILVHCVVDGSGHKTCRKLDTRCAIAENGEVMCPAGVEQTDYLTPATEAELLEHDKKFDALCPKH